MVWQYTLGATKFLASARFSHRCKKVRQAIARLSGSFALPEGGGNGEIERTKPFWLWVGYELKALSLFWLGHFGRGSGHLTTWTGTRMRTRSVVSCRRHWARGVGLLPLIEWLSGTEKLSHDDTTLSILVIVPESVVGVSITSHAPESCRAIRAAPFSA
jgi:hypothetical protein